MSGVKISALPAVVTPALSDIFAIVQAGVTYKESVTQLQSLLTLSSVSQMAVQDQTYTYAPDTGVADAYVVTLSPAPSAYVTGMRFDALIANTNTTASTLNLNSLGAKAIKFGDGAALVAGTLVASMLASFEYDGTNLQILNPMIVPPSSTIITPDIVGVVDGSAAAAGSVGEYLNTVVLVGAAVSLTTTVSTDIAILSLTAGDWDVWGSVWTNPNAATTTQGMAGWISTVSATLPIAPNEGANAKFSVSSVAGAANGFSVGQKRISLAGTTNVYLSMASTFAVNVMSGYGFIGARRVR